MTHSLPTKASIYKRLQKVRTFKNGYYAEQIFAFVPTRK